MNKNPNIIDLKINKANLSQDSLWFLKMMFLEAKWFYNAVVASKTPELFDVSLKNVKGFNQDNKVMNYELKYLPLETKQEIKRQILQSINVLINRPDKSQAGVLKFKSEATSIPLLKETYTLNGYKIKFLNNEQFMFLQDIDKIDREVIKMKLIQSSANYYVRFFLREQ
ncbi:MAG: hypothetical protein LBM99_02500 [Bacillales bacterium]|jgi:hypothetical protein|nr:hypothetical protein [Bacillales bacterium]